MTSRPHKEVLTTGDVARICNVAPRTVAKWFDRGELKGYRIPGSRDRRVPLHELLSFMKKHGIPTDDLETPIINILIYEQDAAFRRGLPMIVDNLASCEARIAESGFDFGLMAGLEMPRVIILDGATEPESARGIVKALREKDALHSVKLIVSAPHFTDASRGSWLSLGAQACLMRPYNAAAVERAVADVLIMAS